MFKVVEVKAVAGNPLWEVKRIRDNQTMTEPFTNERECKEWLKANATDLERRFGA